MYLPIETSTVPGGLADPLYNAVKGGGGGNNSGNREKSEEVGKGV